MPIQQRKTLLLFFDNSYNKINVIESLLSKNYLVSRVSSINEFQNTYNRSVDIIITNQTIEDKNIPDERIVTIDDSTHAESLKILIEKTLRINSLLEEKETLKQELSQTKESDRLKSLFLTKISHEIRTPLNGIIGFLSILSNTELPDPRQQNYIKYISSSSEQLLRVINSVLSLSMIESGEIKLSPEKVQISKIMSSIYSLYETEIHSKHLDFNLILPEEEIEIVTDKEKLTQILNNFLSNAVKFTNEGTITFGVAVKNNKLRFYIKDTGIGIPKKHHSLIFEQFRKVDIDNARNYEGNGLGLNIAKAYAELLKGELCFESEEDKGSVFYLSLPYAANKNDQGNKNKSNKDNSLINWQNKTILIAEDEPINYYYLEQVLTRTRATIIRATNGQEAVEYCEKNSNIDIVLMDIKMPILDGIEATKQIKEKNPNLPVVAQTAHAMISDREKVIAAGCDHYLKKPIKKDDLLNLLSSILDN